MTERDAAIRTFGDLLRYNYRIQVYCPICKVSRPLDLRRQDPDRNYMHATYRCKECRGYGEPIIAPASIANQSLKPPDW